MYNEKSFENYLFWIKARKIFAIISFSIAGCFLGIFISDMVKTLILSDEYRIKIISISTIVFFILSLLITLDTSREIQDGYWKMAVLRKLTVMSKKLDNIENFKEALNDLELTKNNIENKSIETKTEDKIEIEETSEKENTLNKINKPRTILKIKTI